MKLKFLGVGSAFNTGLGNTSAFFFCGETMVLFDCGENVFSTIKKSSVLDGAKMLKVFVTHNHPDHIGSLGSLIFYCFFVKKIPVEVYGDTNLKSILILSGVRDEQYKFFDIFGGLGFQTYSVTPILGMQEFKITPVLTEHYQGMLSVGYHVKETPSKESFYYSGDANKIPEPVRKAFLSGNITYLYQDTSWLDYEGNVHFSYRKLCEAIDTRREFVYIMHTDENFNFIKARHDGFSIAGKKQEE